MKNGLKCNGWLSSDNQFVIVFIYFVTDNGWKISKKCEFRQLNLSLSTFAFNPLDTMTHKIFVVWDPDITTLFANV